MNDDYNTTMNNAVGTITFMVVASLFTWMVVYSHFYKAA